MVASREATTLIVNERAGGGAMMDEFRRLEYRLLDVVGDFETVFTEGPGHATELTRDALRGGAKRIIAGGGDGTANEVVNGFFDAAGEALGTGATLGLLPGGTGGDVRKSLGIGSSDDALDVLARNVARPCDLGHLTYRDRDGADVQRWFFNIASFGFSGTVDRYVGAFGALPGQWAYLAATARALLEFATPAVTLTIDDHFEMTAPITTVAVANGRFFGGGMKVAPEAFMDDGVFDVTVLGGMSRVEMLSLARTIYRGLHVNEPKVVTRRGRVVTARSDEEVPLDVDGEALGFLPARFEVVPQAIQVLTPALFPGGTLG